MRLGKGAAANVGGRSETPRRVGDSCAHARALRRKTATSAADHRCTRRRSRGTRRALGWAVKEEGVVKAFGERSWRALALRGVFGIVFGLAALARPAGTLAASISLFGAYVLADGFFAIVVGARERPREVLWLLEGGLGVLVGTAALSWASQTSAA